MWSGVGIGDPAPKERLSQAQGAAGDALGRHPTRSPLGAILAISPAGGAEPGPEDVAILLAPRRETYIGAAPFGVCAGDVAECLAHLNASTARRAPT